MEASQTPMATFGDAVAAMDRALAVDATPIPSGPAPSEVGATRFVQFTIDATVYAVSLAHVIGADRVPKITRVPHTPGWLRGVANLRGDIVSVVDLRTFLGIDPLPPHRGRLIVVRLPDDDCSLGLLVDTVDKIVTLDPDAVTPPPSPLAGSLAPYLIGTCVVREQLVAVLDLERFLRSAEIRQFDDVK